MSELFWFPLNSLTFVLNCGLWVLIGYIIYEAVKKITNDFKEFNILKRFK